MQGISKGYLTVSGCLSVLHRRGFSISKAFWEDHKVWRQKVYKLPSPSLTLSYWNVKCRLSKTELSSPALERLLS